MFYTIAPLHWTSWTRITDQKMPESYPSISVNKQDYWRWWMDIFHIPLAASLIFDLLHLCTNRRTNCMILDYGIKITCAIWESIYVDAFLLAEWGHLFWKILKRRQAAALCNEKYREGFLRNLDKLIIHYDWSSTQQSIKIYMDHTHLGVLILVVTLSRWESDRKNESASSFPSHLTVKVLGDH